MHRRGFLLIEASISILLAGLFSILLYSWHSQLLTRQQHLCTNVQALCIARTALEKAKQGRSLKQINGFSVSLSRKELLPTYTYLTVIVSQEKNLLVTLSTGMFHD